MNADVLKVVAILAAITVLGVGKPGNLRREAPRRFLWSTFSHLVCRLRTGWLPRCEIQRFGCLRGRHSRLHRFPRMDNLRRSRARPDSATEARVDQKVNYHGIRDYHGSTLRASGGLAGRGLGGDRNAHEEEGRPITFVFGAEVAGCLCRSCMTERPASLGGDSRRRYRWLERERDR